MKENKKYYENREEKYTFIIAGRGAAKTKAMQEYYNKFIKEK